ncbi:hypothetical protein CF165_32705 [Amycolatopsis vastitatis]|uniref:Helix-turn-helix domain-containing protein n=1 Tax=Amycolatopsis vastitatis TaxID=1905142 RepID=A0A229SWJ8_9PSEU|nr:hypothetical protein CF165_32705 [Amycolatopsis vastitatis]
MHTCDESRCGSPVIKGSVVASNNGRSGKEPSKPVNQSVLNTVAETAAKLRCSVPTVRRLIKSGELNIVRIGQGRGLPRVPDSSIKAYVQRHTTCSSSS